MTKRKPLVSIIMPAFNAAAFLDRAVSSVQAQTLTNWELIIVDDASTDATAQKVKALSAADPRIKLLRQRPNGGPSKARNKGLSAAEGKWIAILDADDAMVPQRLERMVIAAETAGADILADNLYLYDAGAERVVRPMLPLRQGIRPLTLLDLFRHDLPASGSYYGWFKPIIRRTLLAKTGIRYRPEYRYGEDFLFYAELLIAGAVGAIDHRPGYLYTTRVGELSGQASSQTRTTANTEELIKAMDWLVATYGGTFDNSLNNAIGFRRAQNQLAPVFAQWKSALKKRPLHAAQLLVQHPGLTWFLLRAFGRMRKTWVLSRTSSEMTTDGAPH